MNETDGKDASGKIRQFSRERLIQQHELFKQGKFPPPHEMIDFGDPVGDELGGPDDPTRNDHWD